jgi:hypothetical protein
LSGTGAISNPYSILESDALPWSSALPRGEPAKIIADASAVMASVAPNSLILFPDGI